MNPLKRVKELESRSKDFGFYWQRPDQILAQIESELLEIKQALKNNDPINLEEEVGDLLHAAASLAVFCDLDPELTLQKSTEKYEKRFTRLQEETSQLGLTHLHNQSFDTLKALWTKAKKLLPESPEDDCL